MTIKEKLDELKQQAADCPSRSNAERIVDAAFDLGRQQGWNDADAADEEEDV